MKKRVSISTILSLIFSISFIINFIWESIHAQFLYQPFSSTTLEFWRIIVYASFIDGLMILLMYLITSLIFKDLYWIKKLNKKSILIFSILGILIAIWIEYRAVYLLHKWQYSNLMPTVFGIGLSPLIQLAITGILTIYTVKNFLK